MQRRQAAITIVTRDGTADAQLFHPAGTGPWPGVLFYMDGLGVRPALLAMAERLAGHGYAVLLPNLYYRSGPRPAFDATSAMADPRQREQVFALVRSIDGALVMRDTQAFLDRLNVLSSVRDGPIGCVGYCMGGGFALLAAATFPDRIAAAASFHGARLATDREDSPHTQAARIRGQVYVAVAEQDPWLEAGETERLRGALTAAGVRHSIEVYAGTQHGFAVPDLPVHDADAAERHWQSLLQVLSGSLRMPRVVIDRS